MLPQARRLTFALARQRARPFASPVACLTPASRGQRNAALVSIRSMSYRDAERMQGLPEDGEGSNLDGPAATGRPDTPLHAGPERTPDEGPEGSGGTGIILALALLGGGLLSSMILQGNKAEAKGSIRTAESLEVIPPKEKEVCPDTANSNPEDFLYGPGASVLLPEVTEATERGKTFNNNWEANQQAMSPEAKKELQMAMIHSSLRAPQKLVLLQQPPYPGPPPGLLKEAEEASFSLSFSYFGLLWASVMGAVAFALPSVRVFNWTRTNLTSGPSTLMDPFLSSRQKMSRIFLSTIGASGPQALFGLVMAHCFLEPLVLWGEAINLHILPSKAQTSAKELTAVFLGTGFFANYMTAAIGRAVNDLRPPSSRGIAPAVFGTFSYLAMKYPETPITFAWTLSPALVWLYPIAFSHAILSTWTMMRPALASWRLKGNPAAVALAASTMNREAIANTVGIAAGLISFFLVHKGEVPSIAFEEGASRRMAYARGHSEEERSGHGQRGTESVDVEGAAPVDATGKQEQDGAVDVVTGRHAAGPRRPTAKGTSV
jgi:hypothetical protein